MNSREMPATNKTTPWARAQRTSTWIEGVAIPLAVSSMEAQPIALVILLLTTIVIGTKAMAPLGAGGVTLLALGLLWWAMIVEHLVRRSSRGRRAALLRALGWLVASAVVVGPRLSFLDNGENIFAVLLEVVLVTWLWRRSIPRAQAGCEYGQFALSFKVGFGVQLGILLIVSVFPQLQTLREALGRSLPIFFLSGLVGLSLVRLGIIRNSRSTLDSSQQADPTRAWLLALTLFGVILLAIVIAIEAIFSFASFELAITALLPLWNALGTLVSWILYGIIFLVSPIFYLLFFLIGWLTRRNAQTQPQNTGTKPSPFHQLWSPQTIPPEVLVIGQWVFLVLALLVLLLVVGASLRRWQMRGNDEEIEEVREGLDARSLLRARWREWWHRRRQRRHELLPLEALDPTSARARYRELLQAMAAMRSDLARLPAETPTEYETRLILQLSKESSENLACNAEAPTDVAILDELTRAYALERYGGKPTNTRLRTYLQTWVPRLLKRLTGRSSISETSSR